MDEENQIEIDAPNFYDIIRYNSKEIITIKKEFNEIKKTYKNDFKIKKYSKIIASICFIFVTHLSCSITYSEWLSKETDLWIGPIEVLLVNSFSGILFSLFGGQPLIILGITGPVVIYTVTMYKISKSLELNFLAFYGFSGFISGLFHILVGLKNWCNIVKYITKFTCELFETLIGVIYTIKGIEILFIIYLNESNNIFLLSFILSMFIYHFNRTLKSLAKSRFFNETFRRFCSDYSVFLSLFISVGLQFIFPNINLDRINVGNGTFVPSYCNNNNCRNWIVNIFDLPYWGFLLGIVSGLILTILFFFDHNIASLLAQQNKFNLKKSPTYNYDFLIIGILIIISSFFGLPPVNGLIPHALLHVKSLVSYDSENNIYVEEQRISNLVKSILMALLCIPFLFKNLIGSIPIASLSGVFIIIGIATFESEFVDRILLFFEDKSMIKQNLYITGSNILEPVTNKKIKIYTIIQIIILIIIYIITRTIIALIFPLFIGILIPLRIKILPKFFTDDELEHMKEE